MTNDRRLNLDEDFDKLASNLLNDVKAATDQVKQRQAALRQAEERSAAKAKSRRLSALLVGIGAVVVLLLSYWIVFARPDSADIGQATASKSVQSLSAPKVAITYPRTSAPSGQVPGPAASTIPSRDSQLVEHPSDDYEPPSADSGM